MKIVYVREHGVLGVIIEEYQEGSRIAWYVDGMSWVSFLEEDEFIYLNLEDLNE